MQTNITDMEQRQSVVIETMRLPLILLVLFIHVLPPDLKQIEHSFSGMNIYRFISEMISHNVGRIAVPCFFVFSGYFFFLKMKRWDFAFYREQLKKRVRTLLIPYLLWNILLIFITFAKYHLCERLNIPQHDEILFLYEHSFLELIWMPIDLPLWFLRDLICMTLLAPFFYYLLRYTKIYGLLALLVLYLTTWDTNIPGFSMTAILYFGLGAYLGIYKKIFLKYCMKFGRIAFVLAFILLILSTFYNGIEPLHEYIIRFFIPLGMIVAVSLMNKMINIFYFRNLFIKLSPTVFFIYAIHEFYIKNWLKGAFYRTPLADSGGGMLIGYVLMPFMALFICLILYCLWKKISPTTLSIMIGGRNK